MKHTFTQNPLKRVAALVLAASLMIPAVSASAGTKRLTTTRTLAEGLTYVNTITDHSSAGRVESFAFQREPDSPVFPIMIQASDTIYGAATINKAVSLAESRGYEVLGGINTDFFGLKSGLPNGLCIENGVYRSSPDGYHAVTSYQGQLSLSASPQVDILLTNQRDQSTVSLNHFNKWRNSIGGLYLYNEDFSTVSTRTDQAGGRMVRFHVVPEDRDKPLTINGQLTLEVVEVFETEDAVPIGADNYILTAAYESGFYEVFASYRPGDRVTLSTSCSDPAVAQAEWATGCGDIMIANGELTNPATWNYNRDGRQPRTALGVKADGTQVFYVVDGRQSGYSGGLSQVDLARELLNQGCVWAVNLDGGGSSTFSGILPGASVASVLNQPSGGSARSCATFLLLVTDGTGQGIPSRLAPREDGPVVFINSSVPLSDVLAVDSGGKTVNNRVSDVVFASSGLGTLNGSVYTAGSTPGTDTITLQSPSLGITGSGQIHVVNALSSLKVSRAGSSSALSQLSMKAGESVQLTASGTYWSHPVALDDQAVIWKTTGDIGSITPDGQFTASGHGSSGTITATAGGITKTIQISLGNVHTDVPPGHWAYDAVEYCYQKGIVSGVSSTEFGQSHPIRRGDFVLMLYNALGQPSFTNSSGFEDVAITDYYARAIAWASSNGLVSGISQGTFAPQTLITREQAFTILHQAMPLFHISGTTPDLSILNQFQDQAQIADYAKPHIAAMVAQGLASGSGGGIQPKSKLSRGEMAVLLYRFLTYTQAPPEPELPPVADPDATLTLDETQITLDSAQEGKLTATLSSGNAPIIWKSSDPSIAAVSPEGVVTNVYAGIGTPSVTITATSGPLSASATVRCNPAEQIGLVTAEPRLNVRAEAKLDSPVIARLAAGRQVVVLGATNADWYQVLLTSESGQAITGYVSSQYVSML